MMAHCPSSGTGRGNFWKTAEKKEKNIRSGKHVYCRKLLALRALDTVNWHVWCTAVFSKSGPARLLPVSRMTMVSSLLWHFFSKFIFQNSLWKMWKKCLAFFPPVRISEDISVQYLSLHPPFWLEVKSNWFGNVEYRYLMSKMLQFASLCLFNHLNTLSDNASSIVKQILPWSMVTDVLYM